MTDSQSNPRQARRSLSRELGELRAFIVLLPLAALGLFCAGTAADAHAPGGAYAAPMPSQPLPALPSSPLLPPPNPGTPLMLGGTALQPSSGLGSASLSQAHVSLPRSSAAFAALLAGQRTDSVRIVWLGDSHTAADFMTGRVRTRLQAVYGAGGPGFVRWGSPAHRHDAATLTRSGRFLVEPISPARRSKHGDGLFGFYGLRVTPKSTPASLSMQASASSLVGNARFSVLFEARGKSAFTLKLGGHTLQVRDGRPGLPGVPARELLPEKLPRESASSEAFLAQDKIPPQRGSRPDTLSERSPTQPGAAATVEQVPRLQRVDGSTITRIQLAGPGTDLLSIELQSGKPRLHGVIIEAERPGLVLDTVGTDGARVATALAWDEGSFVAELSARHPDLFVVAYGTNEAFDALRVSAYDAELSTLLGRVQRASPNAECLVLGPPDALEVDGSPAGRVAEIAEVYARVAARMGCAFWSLQLAMGGPGSFAAWQRSGLAQPDRIHLTKDGYRELGERISAELLGAVGAPATKSW